MKTIDPTLNMAEGASYRTIFSPGKTELKFDKGAPIKLREGPTVLLEVEIDSALVSGKTLLVTWTAVSVRDIWWLPTPNVSDAILVIRAHFEGKNPTESFSVISTELLTEGAVGPKDPRDYLKDAAEAGNKLIPDLGDLGKKIGIALIVLAFSIGIYAAHKVFTSRPSNG